MEVYFEKENSTTGNPADTPTTAPEGKEAAKIDISFENPFSDDAAFANTVLVGTNAEIKVRVTDEDGNPVANKDVQLAKKLVYAKNSTYAN